MSSSSSARWLAPSALAAALLAVIALVAVSFSGGDTRSRAGSGTASSEQRQSGEAEEQEGATAEGEESTGTDTTSTDEASDEPKEKTYTVRAGDTLSSIAASADVAIDEIERLNPGIDSQSLTVGQEIKLAE